jgi:hypothetical protein
MTIPDEQLTLDLEHPVYDHYTIELRKGTPPDNMEVQRSATAESLENAISIIDSFRSRSSFKDHVKWVANEVDGTGSLFGLAEGLTWQIQVVPDLNTPLG